ncbi:hypothetical protein AYL99_00188 [Fonsecaea erecta]|uniref:Uncharacterized protein n=1 Tax=Fonsecaea erecta TaxID=1367422 RepID=A0A178ZXS7_9EURO|nr:hypothetical protein AYL99_00188 [Fonsecaea erecta]OAP64216.1 hypothetical protein AYL99_00188 [Fonsecaea erecta]
MSLENQVIAVTGAGSGIGRATAMYLADIGARVGLLDIRSPQVVAEAINQNYGENRAFACACDVRSSADVDKAFQSIVDALGPLNGAVNLAGVVGKGRKLGTEEGRLKDLADEEWERVVATNLTGTKNCMRAELQCLSPAGGSIVNTASVAGQQGTPYNSAYAVSKAGVISLTKSVAKETGKHNVRINAISPGVVDTPLLDSFTDDSSRPGFMANTNALGRAAQPTEVAKLIAFLLSNDSSYCTGAIFNIDGGW